MNKPKVLLLNQDYSPVNIVTPREAWSLIEDGMVRPAEGSSVATMLRSAHEAFPIPSVLVLRRYTNVPHRTAQWTKTNIMRRDSYTCGYCGYKAHGKARKDMTIDHIIPQSKGGPNTWGNTICACRECNQLKADRTPTQAGMALLWEPKRPRTSYVVASGEVPADWKFYLEF